MRSTWCRGEIGNQVVVREQSRATTTGKLIDSRKLNCAYVHQLHAQEENSKMHAHQLGSLTFNNGLEDGHASREDSVVSPATYTIRQAELSVSVFGSASD